MTDETPKPAEQPDNASDPPPPPPVATAEAEPETTDDEYENVDIYTAEVTCKCGKQIAANAWFCPQCGRPYLVNMLFALIVLATGFALLNHLVQYVITMFSRGGGPPTG